MIYFTSPKENLENIIQLAQSVEIKTRSRSLNELKMGYNRYIHKYQPLALLNDSGPMQATEVVDEVGLRQLSHAYIETSSLNDLNQESMIDFATKSLDGSSARVASSLRQLGQVDPNAKSFFDLAINYYFIAGSQKAGGGSSSAGLGVIWINPREDWLEQDYLEFFIHELTHNLLFIDERRYGHYAHYELMHDPKIYAFSSILNKSRPLDKVMHSLFVAINVLEFRKRYFGLKTSPNLHPSSTKMISSILQTLESVAGLEAEYFLPRLRQLTNQACQLMEAYQ